MSLQESWWHKNLIKKYLHIMKYDTLVQQPRNRSTTEQNAHRWCPKHTFCVMFLSCRHIVQSKQLCERMWSIGKRVHRAVLKGTGYVCVVEIRSIKREKNDPYIVLSTALDIRVYWYTKRRRKFFRTSFFVFLVSYHGKYYSLFHHEIEAQPNFCFGWKRAK